MDQLKNWGELCRLFFIPRLPPTYSVPSSDPVCAQERTLMGFTIWLLLLAGCWGRGGQWESLEETEGWQGRNVAPVLRVRSSDVHPELWLLLGGLFSMPLAPSRLQRHYLLPLTLPGISPPLFILPTLPALCVVPSLKSYLDHLV